MSDDLLERATRALRETGEPRDEDLSRTRARVMESVRTEKRRRARFFAYAFPIAAVLVGTTAWAASTGRLAAIFRQPAKEAPVAVAPPPPVEKAAPAPPEIPPPPAEALPPPVESVASAAPKPSAPRPPHVEVEDASSADLTLYQTAHTLHFVSKRYDAALTAWDDYLRGSPNGAFVAEARYNRAICLVKLGRKAEATLALQPFADGKVAGGYRQAEALKLLEHLAQ